MSFFFVTLLVNTAYVDIIYFLIFETIMLSKNQLINKLNDSKIKYELTEHDPLYTVKDSAEKRGTIYGSHSKNLFLKNKKNKFFLLTCEETDEIDLKKYQSHLT